MLSSPLPSLFLFLSLCASLSPFSIYKSLVLWVATFAPSLSCYEFACIIRKEFLAYGSQSFMLPPLFQSPSTSLCTSLGASEFIQMLALSSALALLFAIARVSFISVRYALWGRVRRGSGIKYCTYRCAGYSPFYYAATLSQLHYVCATLAAPHFAAAAAFATLRIYYKFLHTIYCLSVPPSHGQACRGVTGCGRERFSITLEAWHGLAWPLSQAHT